MDTENNPSPADQPVSPPSLEVKNPPFPTPRHFDDPNAARKERLRRVRIRTFIILFCCFWIYLEWTVNSKMNAELRDGPRFRMVKDTALWGWADYDQEHGIVTFYLGNTGPAAIDFKEARYFILLKNRSRYALDLKKMNGMLYSKESVASSLPAQSGDFKLWISCRLPIEVNLKGLKTPVQKIKGFQIEFKDGKKNQFGYKDLNYLQRIQKFIAMKDARIEQRMRRR